MSAQITSIIRAALRKEDKPLNIILTDVSERYIQYLALTGHNFYCAGRKWNHFKAMFPENVKEISSLEADVGYDLVMSFGRYRNISEAAKIAKSYHIPFLLFEKDLPRPNQNSIKISADYNVFISKYQADAWDFKDAHSLIKNCVDHNLFSYGSKKENVILSAVTRWRERDWSDRKSVV